MCKNMGALGDTLRMLSSSGSIDETIIIPEEDITVEDTPKTYDSIKHKKTKNRNEKDMIHSITTKLYEKVGINEEEVDEMFDTLMDSFSTDEEDVEFRNSLISLGRKYERETRVSAESSEIIKAFSGTEKKINGLIEEVRRDKQTLQQDLEYLHATRTRNAKAISDTFEAKNTLHTLELNALKEINSMTAKKIELQLKAKAQKTDDLAASGMNGNLIQDLFNVGRKNIIEGVGGYAGISGADLSPEDKDRANTTAVSVGNLDDVYNDDDSFIQENYIGDEFRTNSDGEKFLKYKDDDVHYILDVRDGTNQIYAEDKHGTRIEDYPMPSHIEDLSFDYDEREGIAYDDFHRTYKLRK